MYRECGQSVGFYSPETWADTRTREQSAAEQCFIEPPVLSHGLRFFLIDPPLGMRTVRARRLSSVVHIQTKMSSTM